MSSLMTMGHGAGIIAADTVLPFSRRRAVRVQIFVPMKPSALGALRGEAGL